MSHFAFEKDAQGNVKVTDAKAAEALELIVNNLILLNDRFEEAFRTGINIGDIDHGED